MSGKEVIQAQVYSGHESFPIRFTWLTKAVRHCEPEESRDLFSRPDAMVTLGVGKNMVRSMRSWGMSTRMLEADGETSRNARLRPTPLGGMLFGENGVDPFMEDPATIWLIHWTLASNKRVATWYWTFNEFRETEFDKAQLIKRISRASREASDRLIAEDTIERDVDCFLKTYVPSDPDKRLSREELLDCPLTELGLLRRSGGQNTYTFVRGKHDSLPDEIFAYCLLMYWNDRSIESKSLRFEDIAFGAGSPGQIFKLTENAIVDRLHRLPALTRNAIRYDDTAGLRQVMRDTVIDPISLLRSHYETRIMEVRHVAPR
jgi:hypothetical protein